jgi:dipeptidyl aminopeptidase/acylaminoacyl peptidase
MAQRFDVGSLRLTGDPVMIADEVAVNRLDQVSFWVSDAGILAYRTGSNNSWLAWVDRNGTRLEEMQPGGRFDAVALSPDGKRVALCRADNDNNSDVWTYEFRRHVMTRLTYGAGPVDSPVWSPDARQIAFSSSRSGTFQIYRRKADVEGPDEQLTEGPADKFPNDWSRDGRYLLFEQRRRNQVSAIFRLPVDGGREPVPLLEAPFGEGQPAVSPDGKWIAYESTESGRVEVYVRPFSGGSPGPGGKIQVSTGMGGWPRWGTGGKEIFFNFFSSRPRLMAARIRMGMGGIEAEAPVALFYFGGTFTATSRLWDVTADGQHFLTAGQVGLSITGERLNVVVNWHARVNR